MISMQTRIKIAGRELLITLAQALSLAKADVMSSMVYHRHQPDHQQQPQPE
jgi:hypothetical protein